MEKLPATRVISGRPAIGPINDPGAGDSNAVTGRRHDAGRLADAPDSRASGVEMGPQIRRQVKSLASQHREIERVKTLASRSRWRRYNAHWLHPERQLTLPR